MKDQIAAKINILGEFCGRRDVEQLTPVCLKGKYGIKQADVFVLFGGSILAGAEVLAQVIENQLAKHYVIVGGRGHTTASLEEKIEQLGFALPKQDLSEAELFAAYLQGKYGLSVDFLETESTNCGNNITNLLALLKRKKIDFDSIILCQDATMQLRMDAVLRKFAPQNLTIINYASYQAHVVDNKGELSYEQEIFGMWDVERYISLLMGEIPRLRDDEAGYGPRGKNYLAHVNIPPKVEQAFEDLTAHYSHLIREANPLYASK